jgi:hypothetical protein
LLNNSYGARVNNNRYRKMFLVHLISKFILCAMFVSAIFI